MRIHAPEVELPFAGHPSVGTAWLLREKLGEVAVLRPPAGELRVGYEGDIVWVAARPEWSPPFEYVELASAEEVDSLDGAPGGEGWAYCWAWEDEEAGRVRARSFVAGCRDRRGRGDRFGSPCALRTTRAADPDPPGPRLRDLRSPPGRGLRPGRRARRPRRGSRLPDGREQVGEGEPQNRHEPGLAAALRVGGRKHLDGKHRQHSAGGEGLKDRHRLVTRASPGAGSRFPRTRRRSRSRRSTARSRGPWAPRTRACRLPRRSPPEGSTGRSRPAPEHRRRCR